MTVANSIKAQLDEAAHVMRRQMARIAELEAEVERIQREAHDIEVLRDGTVRVLPKPGSNGGGGGDHS